MGKKRLSSYVTSEFAATFEALRAEFGMSEGQLALLLLKLGYEAFMRSYKPQNILSNDDWKRIIEATSDKGMIESETANRNQSAQ
jgi:hypothetical protein